MRQFQVISRQFRVHVTKCSDFALDKSGARWYHLPIRAMRRRVSPIAFPLREQPGGARLYGNAGETYSSEPWPERLLSVGSIRCAGYSAGEMLVSR